MASNKALELDSQLKKYTKDVARQSTESDTKARFEQMEAARGAHVAAGASSEAAVCASNRYMPAAPTNTEPSTRRVNQNSYDIKQAYDRMMTGNATNTMQHLAKRFKT